MESIEKLSVKKKALQIISFISKIGRIAAVLFAISSVISVAFQFEVTRAVATVLSIISVVILSMAKKSIEEDVSEIVIEISHLKSMKTHKTELQHKAEHQKLEIEMAQEFHKQVQEQNAEKEEKEEKELEGLRKFSTETLSKEDAEKLDSMIGLDSVKKQLKKMRATMEYDKENKNEHFDAVYHMRFTGNPGTGKTTVAKVMGAMLYDVGVIEKPKYVAVNGNELMGYYLGQTAPTINALFKSGDGGVIFIDEAYALAQSAGTSRGDGYSAEAVNQLLTLLERPENKTVVIFGGYTNELNEFFNMNPGLRSRVPITLDFPDYTADELLQILEINLKKRGHGITSDANDALLQVFQQKIELCRRYGSPFSNGRYARNVSDELHSQHAINYSEDKSIGTDIIVKDIDVDTLINLD